MPELPDIEMYLACLRPRLIGETLKQARIYGLSVLKTVEPPVSALIGCRTTEIRRIGKRIAIGFEGDLWLVVHLMIAGRLRWKDGFAPVPLRAGKIDHAAFAWTSGTLTLTEASSKKRAHLMVVTEESLAKIDPGGIDPLGATDEEIAARLTATNRTLKRALTTPQAFSGIGNAYSDEILFQAKLSPVRLTQSLSAEELARLAQAIRTTLTEWRDRLIAEFATKFPGPGQVTAFRPDFAVHGRYRQPCPVCGKPVQHIVHAENETNYCAQCQNEGRLLADRALSRLLKKDWPRTLEELEAE